MSKITAADFDALDEDSPEDDDATRDAAARLIGLVERIERIEEEMSGLKADRSDVYAEVKAAGYDVPVVRAIVRRRRIERAAREEMDDLIATYERAIEGQIG